MNSNRHAGSGNSGKTAIVALDGALKSGVRISSSNMHAVAQCLVQVMRVIRCIQLDIRYSFGYEPLHIVPDDIDKIGQKVGPVRIKAIGDAVLVARNQKVRRSGDGHLKRPARITFQERQFVSAEVTALSQLAAGSESNAR